MRSRYEASSGHSSRIGRTATAAVMSERKAAFLESDNQRSRATRTAPWPSRRKGSGARALDDLR